MCCDGLFVPYDGAIAVRVLLSYRLERACSHHYTDGAAMKKIVTPKGIKVSSHLKAGARYSWFK
jgi:hypothetical protein